MRLFTEDIKDDPEAQELVLKWISELRSGKYPQKPGWLHVTGEDRGYCCLGVLCETARLRFEAHPSANAVVFYYVGPEGFRESSTLPDDFRKKIHLFTTNGEFRDGWGLTSLTEMNDGGDSFEDIANVIEKEFRLLVPSNI